MPPAPSSTAFLFQSRSIDGCRAEVQSTVLVFEKVPTKGFKLEILDDRIRRAKIPGGWLVTIRDEGITFVPDPRHEWGGGSMA